MAAHYPNRAGTYVHQPGEYQAFIPAPLPPEPPISISPQLSLLLSEADLALGRLDGVADTLPNPDLFVAMYVRQEAVLSSQIEGTQASLLDVLEFEAQARNKGQTDDVIDVVNYVKAMDYGLKRLDDLPVSLRLLREIHQKLLTGIRGGDRNPGEFRRIQNWIGAPGSTIRTASFVPPPPRQMITALGQLERFIHYDTPMPFVMKVGLVHAQFETIHPFLDGNGRTGRLLITFLLCQEGILKRPLLYLSHYIKRYKSEYYDRLQAVRDDGDWEGWMEFFLRGVREVAGEATQTARSIAALRERHRELMTQEFSNNAGNALTLLEALYWNPIISVNLAANITGLSYPNANTVVKRLEELGILGEVTGQRRNRRFAYRPFLDLFSA